GLLERRLLNQVGKLTEYHFHLVAGNPSGSKPENLPDHVRYHTHLNAENLSVLMQQCGLIVCRSGYSTLMDLAVLGKKALLIPTPGQTEQMYLGKKLQRENRCYCVEQSAIELAVAIPKALTYSGIVADFFPADLNSALSKNIQMVRSNQDVNL
ncbi:MAG TPA: glycosyltransferase, partial [Dyadobacter sp.]|nr:glycosyltransferase [Dyadobacter sp.]